MRKPFSSLSAKQAVEPAARGPLLAMRRRDFIVILRGMTVTPPKGNASANARKLALCERTASEKWYPTYLRTLTDVRDGTRRGVEVSVWSGPLPSLKKDGQCWPTNPRYAMPRYSSQNCSAKPSLGLKSPERNLIQHEMILSTPRI